MPRELKDQEEVKDEEIVEEEEAVEEEEEVEDGEEVQEEGEEVEADEESEEEEIPSWASSMMEENKQLRQQLQMLASGLQNRQSQQKQEPKEERPDPLQLSLVTEEDMDEALSSPKKLNELLSKVANTVVEQVDKRYQSLRADLPKYMKAVYDQQEQTRAKDKQFWQDNPDLLQGLKDPSAVEARKNQIALIANDIYSRNPEVDMDTLMMQTATMARMAFGINQGQPRKARSRQTKAARMFGQAGAGKPNVKTKSKVEKEKEARQEEVRKAFL